MPTNLSEVAAANNLFGVFDAMNTVTGGLIANLSLLTVFVGLLSMSLLRQNPPQESVFFASLVTTIVAVLFLYMDIIAIVWVIAGLIVTVGAAISLALRR